MTDEHEETAAEFLARLGLDAQLWAREFCLRFAEYIDGETVDEHLMIVWFANAIETGRSAGISETIKGFEGMSRGWCAPSP